MGFEDIIGQSLLVDSIKRIISSGRIVHAYLFAGPPGAGKRTITNIFAQALLCESKLNKPCGKCGSCTMYRSGNHPDIQRIAPEKGSITIDVIRDMQMDVQVRPYMGERKIYMIEDAHTMNVYAQNALLKTLEEPPKFIVIILLTDRTESLLPTIQSRCQIFRLKTLSRNQLADILVKRLGITRAQAIPYTRMSEGLPGKALGLANALMDSKDSGKYGKYGEFMEGFYELVNKIGTGLDIESIFQNSFLTDNKERIGEILDLLMLWFRDILIYQETGEEELITNITKINIIEAHSKIFTIDAIKDIIEGVEKTKRMLKSNTNYQLTIENMLLSLQRR